MELVSSRNHDAAWNLLTDKEIGIRRFPMTDVLIVASIVLFFGSCFLLIRFFERI